MNSPRTWLRKARQLTIGDWLFIGRAWGLLLCVDLGLRLVPFKTFLHGCRRIIDRAMIGAPTENRTDAAQVSARLSRLVAIAGRYHLIHATCLKKALVLSYWLARNGYATDLRIGVTKAEGHLKAHAWLEREGQAVFGLPGSEGYEPLFSSCMKAHPFS